MSLRSTKQNKPTLKYYRLRNALCSKAKDTRSELDICFSFNCQFIQSSVEPIIGYGSNTSNITRFQVSQDIKIVSMTTLYVNFNWRYFRSAEKHIIIIGEKNLNSRLGAFYSTSDPSAKNAEITNRFPSDLCWVHPKNSLYSCSCAGWCEFRQ